MGRFLPPDHSQGDERTIGGYMAVHARPAAFEGSDGLSYSVAIETEETGDPAAPSGAYLLFVRWSAGEPRPSGHLETPFLARAATAGQARELVGALGLDEVKRKLDELIAAAGPPPDRPWWQAMNEPPDEDGGT
jgi:hypothetical protein